nr:hypothetical protein CFP56_34923 [Quercus suber]
MPLTPDQDKEKCPRTDRSQSRYETSTRVFASFQFSASPGERKSAPSHLPNPTHTGSVPIVQQCRRASPAETSGGEKRWEKERRKEKRTRARALREVGRVDHGGRGGFSGALRQGTPGSEGRRAGPVVARLSILKGRCSDGSEKSSQDGASSTVEELLTLPQVRAIHTCRPGLQDAGDAADDHRWLMHASGKA